MTAVDGAREWNLRVSMEFKFDNSTAGGLAAFNAYRNIPAHAHVSGIGVQIERADPIVARSKTRDRGVSLEIGLRLRSEKFELGNVRSDPLDALSCGRSAR